MSLSVICVGISVYKLEVHTLLARGVFKNKHGEVERMPKMPTFSSFC